MKYNKTPANKYKKKKPTYLKGAYNKQRSYKPVYQKPMKYKSTYSKPREYKQPQYTQVPVKNPTRETYQRPQKNVVADIIRQINQYISLDLSNPLYAYAQNAGALITVAIAARGLYVKGKWVIITLMNYSRQAIQTIWDLIKPAIQPQNGDEVPNLGDMFNDDFFDDDQGGGYNSALQRTIQRLTKERKSLLTAQDRLKRNLNGNKESIRVIQTAQQIANHPRANVEQPAPQQDQPQPPENAQNINYSDFMQSAIEMGVDLGMRYFAPPGVKGMYNLYRGASQAASMGSQAMQVMNSRLQQVQNADQQIQPQRQSIQIQQDQNVQEPPARAQGPLDLLVDNLRQENRNVHREFYQRQHQREMQRLDQNFENREYHYQQGSATPMPQDSSYSANQQQQQQYNEPQRRVDLHANQNDEQLFVQQELEARNQQIDQDWNLGNHGHDPNDL